MSAVKHVPVSQPLPKVSDPGIIPKRIPSPSSRVATPPSPASSSSTVSQEDEIAVSHKSEPKPEAISHPELETPEAEKIIDKDIFRQILDLDEEDNHDFSLSMVKDYYKQAEDTLQKLEKNIVEEDLSELSALGHFLKGSSATMGLIKVQASCEKIQHYGTKRDEEAKKDLKPEDALDKIKNQLGQLREEYAEAKQYLKDLFRKLELGSEDLN